MPACPIELHSRSPHRQSRGCFSDEDLPGLDWQPTSHLSEQEADQAQAPSGFAELVGVLNTVERCSHHGRPTSTFLQIRRADRKCLRNRAWSENRRLHWIQLVEIGSAGCRSRSLDRLRLELTGGRPAEAAFLASISPTSTTRKTLHAEPLLTSLTASNRTMSGTTTSWPCPDWQTRVLRTISKFIGLRWTPS